MASIVRRGKGIYVVYKYKDEEGNTKQKWERVKTLAEAKARQKEIEYKVSAGTFIVPQCKTLKDLLEEYKALYGKNKWAISTYASNIALLDHYVIPIIGHMKLNDITPRVLEQYYMKLLKTPAVVQPGPRKKLKKGKAQSEQRFVTTATVRDIHKLLRSCFTQALKWELIDRNPAALATLPKHEAKRREIWTAETLFHAIDLCEDERLKLAMNLAFSCSLRKGELLGLTWDCVDISPEAIASGYASVVVNKELQRVSRSGLEELEQKDILFVFPAKSSMTQTVLVLKTPKTRTSIRKVFLPATVAEMLIAWKKRQDYEKEALGEEYSDYDLVIAGPLGMPTESSTITEAFSQLIKDNDLPKVVFHSLRHSSITYKLKLNGGDVKSVQGDSGHAQASMVTEVYSHILDDDRRHNAELFEKEFYSGKGKAEEKEKKPEEKKLEEKNPEEKKLETETVQDLAALAKMLTNPETAGLLKALMAAMGK